MNAQGAFIRENSKKHKKSQRMYDVNYLIMLHYRKNTFCQVHVVSLSRVPQKAIPTKESSVNQKPLGAITELNDYLESNHAHLKNQVTWHK